MFDDGAAGDGAVLGRAGVQQETRELREGGQHPLRSSRVGTPRGEGSGASVLPPFYTTDDSPFFGG